MPTPTGEKITSAHPRYLALKDVVQFPSDSYTLASASNVFFLKWSELGKWRILVDASAPYRCSATGTGVKTIYLNASECQISRYSTYIAPKLLAGKNGHLSYHTPSHWVPPSFFFFFLSSLLQYGACLEHAFCSIEGDWRKWHKLVKNISPPFSDLFKHYVFALGTTIGGRTERHTEGFICWMGQRSREFPGLRA